MGDKKPLVGGGVLNGTAYNSAWTEHWALQTVEGEIGLVIDYQAGSSAANDVLGSALKMIAALDGLDKALLSPVDSSLEPVSILNDVQHSSLKLLLARQLRNISDQALNNLEWRKWVGDLLVNAKYVALRHLESDTAQLGQALGTLAGDYRNAPCHFPKTDQQRH